MGEARVMFVVSVDAELVYFTGLLNLIQNASQSKKKGGVGCVSAVPWVLLCYLFNN